MTGRIAASDFYYMLPRRQWFRVCEEVDRQLPNLGYKDRKIQISATATYLGRRTKWGEVVKRGKRGHMEYMVIA